MDKREQNLAGYEQTEKPGDDTVAAVRRKYHLGVDASIADIEPVAKKLLNSPLTSLEAAQLILNRRVDGRERMIGELMFDPSLDSDEKFALLLMEKATEKEMSKKGIKDFGTKKSFFE